jgi:hypothetical protein
MEQKAPCLNEDVCIGVREDAFANELLSDGDGDFVRDAEVAQVIKEPMREDSRCWQKMNLKL